MSGEFRETHGSYFHEQLRHAVEEHEGTHKVTRALNAVYAAVAPIEKACAWFEAGDCGASEPALALLDQIGPLKESVRALERLAEEYRRAVTGAKS